jgi:cysteine desulfurase family protein (TIGR01976 family)
MTLQALDIQTIRQQFPSLHISAEGGTPPIYFDNPAGTQVPQVVIDAVGHYYRTMNANSGGAFETSQRTDAMVAEARQTVADFLNAPQPIEIVFGPNMTTLCFSLSRAIDKTLQPGDEIVLTRMDHDANVTPWKLIARDNDLTVRWVDIHTEDCTLNMDTFEAALTDRTKVVATVHASNAVGTLNPVRQIADMAHAAGALYVVDGVQSTPHTPIDVQAIGCDFFLCSAYKFFGPHIGILWGRHELLSKLPAYKVRPAKDKAPYRWETGTASFETIAGTMAAVNYLGDIGHHHGAELATQFTAFEGRRLEFKTGMAVVADYERHLVAHLISELKSVAGVEIVGITDPNRLTERVPTVVITKQGYTPRQIAEHLAKQGIYVWDGDYYAVEIMERLGKAETGGMVRIGLAHYNTREEVDRLIGALHALT